MNVNIKAIIFDYDGLLADTEGVFDLAIKEMLGSPFPAHLRHQMLGRKPYESALIFSNYASTIGKVITPEQYLKNRQPILDRLFQNVSLMPGAANLVEHFRINNIPQAIATSSSSNDFIIKTGNHPHIRESMQIIITGDQIKNGKPDPEIFLKASAELKINPENCLVFEDSFSGIESAKNAGMSCVGVANLKYLDKEILSQADQVITSLKDFEPTNWHLPSY